MIFSHAWASLISRMFASGLLFAMSKIALSQSIRKHIGPEISLHTPIFCSFIFVSRPMSFWVTFPVNSMHIKKLRCALFSNSINLTKYFEMCVSKIYCLRKNISSNQLFGKNVVFAKFLLKNAVCLRVNFQYFFVFFFIYQTLKQLYIFLTLIF